MRRRKKHLAESRPLRAAGVVLALVALLFVAMRLFTAWLLRSEVNGDLAIVQTLKALRGM